MRKTFLLFTLAVGMALAAQLQARALHINNDQRRQALCPCLAGLEQLQQQLQFRLGDGSRLQWQSRENDYDGEAKHIKKRWLSAESDERALKFHTTFRSPCPAQRRRERFQPRVEVRYRRLSQRRDGLPHHVGCAGACSGLLLHRHRTAVVAGDLVDQLVVWIDAGQRRQAVDSHGDGAVAVWQKAFLQIQRFAVLAGAG